ncbi:MAG: EAL domain-containing protein [Gammaproteobacteria bacterium]|nr:EAL domain-containing protein [Gammaproteobacteria bacterium]
MNTTPSNIEPANGADALDRDHRILLTIIKRYQLSIANNTTHSFAAQLFEDLREYASQHFARVEKVLTQTDYPGIAQHIDAHHLFSSELNRFQQLYTDLPGLFPHKAMLAFLNKWLTSHTSIANQSYKQHLKEHWGQVNALLDTSNTPSKTNSSAQPTPSNCAPKLRVLDDEHSIGQLICNVASTLGLETKTYQSAKDFYSGYEDDISAIILDLHMPDIDGVEVIRDLAQRQCQAQIILISGFDGTVLHSAEELAVSQGLNLAGSLTKPFRIIELHELLVSLVGKRASEETIVAPPKKKPEFTREDIEKALLEKQFKAYYQPQLALRDQALVGVEVLCRWQHPELGIIPPCEFIPIAERYNLIDALTWRILTQAITQAREWQSIGLDIQLSINISASMFNHLDLPEKILQLTQQHHLQPQKLVIEVTESVVMDQQVKALDSLTRLRLKGFQVSIDDFGTGYSSMLQLHRIPFSEIKVDQSFVLKMQTDPEAQAIAETVIMLGHKLGLTVVAEGIEDAATLAQLKLLNCQVGQGFHFAKPMSPTDFISWVQQDRKDNLPDFHLLSA